MMGSVSLEEEAAIRALPSLVGTQSIPQPQCLISGFLSLEGSHCLLSGPPALSYCRTAQALGTRRSVRPRPRPREKTRARHRGHRLAR